MARSIRDTNSRGSRNWGYLSGATITTHPSGVTISKNNIDLTSGYVLPYATADSLVMTTGVLSNTGGSIARQSLGLSAIHNVIASASSKGAYSTVTGIAVMVTPEGGKSFGSGCTSVTFTPYKLNRAGVTMNSVCSIHYFAVGTA